MEVSPAVADAQANENIDQQPALPQVPPQQALVQQQAEQAQNLDANGVAIDGNSVASKQAEGIEEQNPETQQGTETATVSD